MTLLLTRDCGILPPGWVHELANGEPCPLPICHGTTHETTTPDGKTWTWDGFECAYPENCLYDESDGECCCSYGEKAA